MKIITQTLLFVVLFCASALTISPQATEPKRSKPNPVFRS